MRFDLLDEYGSVYRNAATKSCSSDEENGFDERNPVPLRAKRARLFGSSSQLTLGAAAFFAVLALLSFQ